MSVGCLSHMPSWGPGLQPRRVPDQNQTGDFSVCRLVPSPQSHTRQGKFLMFSCPRRCTPKLSSILANSSHSWTLENLSLSTQVPLLVGSQCPLLPPPSSAHRSPHYLLARPPPVGLRGSDSNGHKKCATGTTRCAKPSSTRVQAAHQSQHEVQAPLSFPR